MDVTTAIRRLHLHAVHADEDDAGVATVIDQVLAALPDVERHAVVRHAYWWMPEVPTAALRAAVGGDEVLRALAGRGPVVGACGGCARVVRARSRDAVDADLAPRCAECRARPSSPPARNAAGFAWEFQPPPQPWQPPSQPPSIAVVRSWAEHYPDPEAA